MIKIKNDTILVKFKSVAFYDCDVVKEITAVVDPTQEMGRYEKHAYILLGCTVAPNVCVERIPLDDELVRYKEIIKKGGYYAHCGDLNRFRMGASNTVRIIRGAQGKPYSPFPELEKVIWFNNPPASSDIIFNNCGEKGVFFRKGDTENKMGRPLKTEYPRNERLSLRLNKNELQEIDEVARKIGKNRIDTVLEGIRKLKKDE